MIQKKDTNYARNLIESINHGLDKIDSGADVVSARTEAGYLAEKIGKLYDLHFVEK